MKARRLSLPVSRYSEVLGDTMSDPQATEIVELKQQIDTLRQQLAQAQRLTAVGELTSTITHEFNNLLMSIINYARMGLRHKDDATRDKAFDRILIAGNRASKVTNTVLALARNRSSSAEPTDMVRLVEDALLLLEREMRKYRIAVDTELADVPKGMVNGNQIQQVLVNLLINARQAMPNGGRMIIRLAHDAEAGTVDLVVRDFGTGIPADKLPHIFDPFYSTKSGPDESGKGGTGLGLSMCRDIIEAHKGRIRVESTVGKGTAFTLKLPIAETKSRSSASLPIPPVSFSNSGATSDVAAQ
jgi:signal transduction histidine kinase